MAIDMCVLCDVRVDTDGHGAKWQDVTECCNVEDSLLLHNQTYLYSLHITRSRTDSSASCIATSRLSPFEVTSISPTVDFCRVVVNLSLVIHMG